MMKDRSETCDRSQWRRLMLLIHSLEGIDEGKNKRYPCFHSIATIVISLDKKPSTYPFKLFRTIVIVKIVLILIHLLATYGNFSQFLIYVQFLI